MEERWKKDGGQTADRWQTDGRQMEDWKMHWWMEDGDASIRKKI